MCSEIKHKQNNDVIIIKQTDMFVNEIKSLGYSVEKAYYGNNLLLRLLRKLCFNLRWFNNLWYNKRILNYSVSHIIIFDPIITYNFIKWLNSNFVDSKISLICLNLIRPSLHIEDLKTFCDVYTFDLNEKKRYSLNWYSGAYFPYIINKKNKIFDIIFIGRDKGRKALLSNLQKKFNKLNLTTYFYIVGDNGWRQKFNNKYKKSMTYKECIQHTLESKAILDIVQKDQIGPTFRVFESIFYEIKLITNNKAIQEYDFYNKNNIFILGLDSMDNLESFINGKFVAVDSNIKNRYTVSHLLDRIIKNN